MYGLMEININWDQVYTFPSSISLSLQLNLKAMNTESRIHLSWNWKKKQKILCVVANNQTDLDKKKMLYGEICVNLIRYFSDYFTLHRSDLAA